MQKLLVTVLICLAVLPARADTIFGRDGRTIDREELVESLATADIVLLGEVHDHPSHHLTQAWLVEALRPKAVVFEMLTPKDDGPISRYLAGGGAASGIGPLVGWAERGWPDWEIYRPVFEAIREGVRVAGAGVPRAELRKVMATEDLATLAPDPALAPELSRALDPGLRAELEQEMVDAHCGHLPREMAPMMVRAQRLRDATLAAVAARELRAGGPVVVITGNGHARIDRGVPAYLRTLAPGARILSLGQIEAVQLAQVDPVAQPYDYLWITPPHPRPDLCEALKKD